MKVLWIYLVGLCLAIHQSVGISILQTSDNTKDDVTGEKDSKLNSLIDDTLKFMKSNETPVVEEIATLTSCPRGVGEEGVYVITLPGMEAFPVLCNAKIAGAGYNVIASRSNSDVNFLRRWKDYKKGFGQFSGDFFIGLDKLHAITKAQNHDLYIHLEDFDGKTRFARYSDFYIENENQLYKMSRLGSYTGDAGDSLSYHKNQKFSTYDRDNDSWKKVNCALDRRGAWWYNGCTDSNLFGAYTEGAFNDAVIGMVWYHWRGSTYSYKSMKMMVRPK